MEINSSKSFLGIIIFSVIVAIAAFTFKTCQYNNQMDEITQMQQEDSRQFKEIVSSLNAKHLYNKDVKDEIINAIDNHSSKMQRELELATTNLQSDIDLLSLWASIITIVFLVFSIYSIFKTEELLSQSKKAFENIKNKEKEANTISADLQNKNNAIIQDFSQKIGLIETRAANVDKRLAELQKQEDTTGSSTEVSTDEQTEEGTADSEMTPDPNETPEPPTAPPAFDEEQQPANTISQE